MISAVERIYQPLCTDKGLTLQVESNITGDVMVKSDQTRLNQILFNLLNNAVKFTHEGSIDVALNLNCHDGKNYLAIKVADSGIGIKESDLEIIFEPFMQAESTTTREYGGSGLGLAIVKSLVEMMGGQIEVSSRFACGTRFTILLPVERVTSAAAAGNLEQQRRYDLFDYPLNVLLVEDNKTNAFIAQAFCRKYGMQVTWVKDGLHAIELLEEQQFDLILMDNQLPYLDGVEATKIIKKEMKHPTPVYACTADGMDATREAFFAAGAEYVIVKPIKEQTLHQALLHFQSQLNQSQLNQPQPKQPQSKPLVAAQPKAEQDLNEPDPEQTD